MRGRKGSLTITIRRIQRQVGSALAQLSRAIRAKEIELARLKREEANLRILLRDGATAVRSPRRISFRKRSNGGDKWYGPRNGSDKWHGPRRR
jgi:hypothetical protein